MKFDLDVKSVFNWTLHEYDRISPQLVREVFEQAGTPLMRAHLPDPKEEIKLDMLISFNQSGSPQLQLSGQEAHSLISPVSLVRNMLDGNKYPDPKTLGARILELVDYKRTSAGHLSNALTFYLCAKALQYIGIQTGVGSNGADVSPLEQALGLK